MANIFNTPGLSSVLVIGLNGDLEVSVLSRFAQDVYVEGDLYVGGVVVQPEWVQTDQIDITTNSSTIVPLQINYSGGTNNMIEAVSGANSFTVGYTGDITTTGNVSAPNITTIVNDLGTLDTALGVVEDKTQNIASADADTTTTVNRWNFRDSDSVIRVVVDPDGVANGNEVVSTSLAMNADLYLKTAEIRADTITSSTGGDITLSNDFANLGVSGNARFDSNIESVGDITSTGTITARLFRGLISPLSGNGFEIYNQDTMTNSLYVNENGNFVINSTLIFEPSDAQISGATGNASFNNVGLTSINSNVSATEIGYLNGVSSSIQTQLDGKQASNSNLTTITTSTTGDIIYSSATDTLAKLAIGSNGQVLKVSGGIPSWQAESGGSFNPSIISPTTGDFINYNTYTSAWENALVPTLTDLTFSTKGNILTLSTPTFIFANVALAANGYEAELASDSGFSNIIHTFAPQANGIFDTTAYVSDGTTYYIRGRCLTNLFSRKTQWVNTSFVATDSFAPTVVWAWAYHTTSNNTTFSPITNYTDITNSNTTSTLVFPPDQANTTAWYSANGASFSQAQRASIAQGKQSSMGTQAIYGNPSYSFDTDDVIATAQSAGGGPPAACSLVFDLGQNRTVSKYTIITHPLSAKGGWGSTTTYYQNATLDRWDTGTSQWINILTLPSSGITNDQVFTGTFASVAVRYYRLRSQQGNYAVCSACNLSAS